MEKFDWHQKLKPLLFLFKIVGLWPKEQEVYSFNFYTLYTVLSFILFDLCHNFFQIVQLFLIPMDLEALAGTLFISVQVVAVVKVFAFITRMKMIKELMRKLNDDIFQPRTYEQRGRATAALQFWWRIYVGYQISLACTVVLWSSFPLLDKSYKESRLPLPAWYPYDYTRSPFYEITYFYQSFSLAFLNVCNSNLDMFAVCLMIYIGAQCDILCDNLKLLRGSDSKGRYHHFNEELIKIIKEHKEILIFVTKFNIFVDKILLTQFVTTATSLSLCLFQLTLIPPLTSEFFSMISAVMSATFQIFLYCWYGNEIGAKSSKITYSAFESDWIGASSEAQRTLLIFVLRTHRQITIKTFNLFPLSLGTFMTIMRTAWSYFAVLRQVNILEQN
ncbi:hypothetical protein Zmor_007663 [Zophobas morio]|uniref:Odorant receptor n=1 Tax=Zophobas morio TaxID=2755281 RepID=A0AA38J2G6_9CUCU|nr:hypothetical protein Zmor_007663 [Zophobas morio]